MTTRNEWIAETAREYNCRGTMDADGNRAGFDDFASALEQAERDAAVLESANVAPWQTRPPAPTPSVEAEAGAVALLRRLSDAWGKANADDMVIGFRDARFMLDKIDANGGASEGHRDPVTGESVARKGGAK